MQLQRDKKLHSREHVLADDLSQTLGEPKRFAMYLGIAKLYEESDLRSLAKYAAQKKELPTESMGKYFMACLKNLQRKNPPPKKTPGRRKKKIPADIDTKPPRLHPYKHQE